MTWAAYHIGEEFFIGATCALVALRIFTSKGHETFSDEVKSRIYLVGWGFIVLALSSAAHAGIHAFGLDLNLLYQTLVGYTFGLVLLVVGIASETPWTKRLLPLLYVPLLGLLLPSVHTLFPFFDDFRPLVWVVIAYLSGVVCILYVAVYYRTRAVGYLYSAAGHLLICAGAILLFFPSRIGSDPWLYGHLLRPLGFVVLLFSMTREDLSKLTGSFLYKALAAFSLIAAIPLLFIGSVIFYETISPSMIAERRMIVFLLVLVTLASALLFGLGVLIRLIRPLLSLKNSVSGLVDKGLNERIPVSSNNEIGELTSAFNDMIDKLRNSMAEQDRLSRLAAAGELSATLAHEIRNPLNAIGGAATYIGENYQGSLVKEFTRIIEHEVSRINKLTTALLNFAKPLTPEPVPGDINALVNDTVRLLEPETKELDVEIELALADDIPPVTFDYNQITQILINLVINALDAVSDGKEKGHIRIRTLHSGRRVLLSVGDNGRGIPEEHMANIFNPFFTTKTRGTGLGLAMSKKIAREHGGDLMVESSKENGTTFTLTVPIWQ